MVEGCSAKPLRPDGPGGLPTSYIWLLAGQESLTGLPKTTQSTPPPPKTVGGRLALTEKGGNWPNTKVSHSV